MKVRSKKRPPVRKGGEPTPKVPSSYFTFPAPVRGWVLDEPLSAHQPGGALLLDNWICTTTGVKVRGGTKKHATIDAAVRSMFTYRVDEETFFAATDTGIYDITSPIDPEVAPSAAVTGQTDGYYSTEQFGTAGGDYLYAVNGVDPAQLYDGTTWATVTDVSTPAITGVASSDLSHVWAFASRLFFVETGTMVAWYLPVDSIGGAAASFSLAGVFKKGGSLLFGATWSLDAGDGLDDKCVFVSTEGEVAVYEGTNPGSAADWRKVGVYQITKPLGQKATMQAGGDLLIATETGVVPISAAINTDVGALSMQSLSAKISTYWQSQAGVLVDHPWEIIKWPQKNIMVISQPGADNDVGSCLVANLQTGAWSRFTGFATRCLGFFDGSGFCGDSGGAIYRMERGGSDNGAIYTASLLKQHSDMNAPGQQKTVTLMRPLFRSTMRIDPYLTAQTNYKTESSGLTTNVQPDIDVGTWDLTDWDNAVWDGVEVPESSARWQSIGRTGYTIAPELQISFGNVNAPNVELVLIDAQYHTGTVVA